MTHEASELMATILPFDLSDGRGNSVRSEQGIAIIGRTGEYVANIYPA
ncbi:hypothetical protein [Acetobacter fallax]|uniref:Uncharacterized protein n=1 Tax=Acetobacter fallax TaxID=1737473 RepID=A0ABX0KCC2_9PROT|nr:hypothetical protein [Acetobacter fallax]NHO33104.1 hypothetical protein [Acetobacter fallax]NHO36747.1 hypothetical protein [Acetobacter fallax]